MANCIAALRPQSWPRLHGSSNRQYGPSHAGREAAASGQSPPGGLTPLSQLQRLVFLCLGAYRCWNKPPSHNNQQRQKANTPRQRDGGPQSANTIVETSLGKAIGDSKGKRMLQCRRKNGESPNKRVSGTTELAISKSNEQQPPGEIR